jgi:hypothetical protein
MKKLKKGDIVTPKETTGRFQKFQEYQVLRTDNNVFYIMDDLGFVKQCYYNGWELVPEKKIEALTAFILIASVLFTVLVLIASYLFEGI